MTHLRSHAVVRTNNPSTARAGGNFPSRIVVASPGWYGHPGNITNVRGSRPSLLQAKLHISQPGDKYELEADRVADQVMRMPVPALSSSRIDLTSIRALSIQRQCAACEDEADLRRKTNEPHVSTSSEGFDSVAATLSQSGRPLDHATRGFFEPRFGFDFSAVRIHANTQATESARAVNALAYTVGTNVVFNSGQYAPQNDIGKRLLAHELTHVVQQGGAYGPHFGHDGENVAGPLSRPHLHSLEPVVQRQDVEVDLEVPTPEERARLRGMGIELPGVSSSAADPRRHSDYVDNRVDAVGFGIYLGGYNLYLDGLDIPVFVRDDYFDFGANNMAPTDLGIFSDYSEALANIPMGPPALGQPIPYAYFRGAGGAVVAPTLFTPITTPRVIQTALEARRQLAEYVQEALTGVAIGIVGGMIIRGVIGWLARVGGGRGARSPSRLSPAATRARDLARQTRERGEPVVANMGGAGAPHELPGAININNQAVGRRGIPNHVDADASDIGQLFDAGSVDQVVGYHMPPSVINWQRATPGIHSALRSGGTFRFDWRGATSEAVQVARLLREAGFRDVENIADAVVTAIRP